VEDAGRYLLKIVNAFDKKVDMRIIKWVSGELMLY